jgi:hypothetical protein
MKPEPFNTPAFTTFDVASTLQAAPRLPKPFEPIGNRREEFGEAEGRIATERAGASESIEAFSSLLKAKIKNHFSFSSCQEGLQPATVHCFGTLLNPTVIYRTLLNAPPGGILVTTKDLFAAPKRSEGGLRLFVRKATEAYGRPPGGGICIAEAFATDLPRTILRPETGCRSASTCNV